MARCPYCGVFEGDNHHTLCVSQQREHRASCIELKAEREHLQRTLELAEQTAAKEREKFARFVRDITHDAAGISGLCENQLRRRLMMICARALAEEHRLAIIEENL